MRTARLYLPACSAQGGAWSREEAWSRGGGLVPGDVWSWGCLVLGGVTGPGGCGIPAYTEADPPVNRILDKRF